MNHLFSYFPFLKNCCLNHQALTGGCANYNIKLNLTSPHDPLILRVYLRDPEAAYCEQNLYNGLHSKLPLPQSYLIRENKKFTYALVEFKEGISLRDLMINSPIETWGPIVHNAGQMLYRIQKHIFSASGFFNRTLKVKHRITSDDYFRHAKNCLQNPIVNKILRPEVISKIELIINKLQPIFRSFSDCHLVHGDYDPSNILVHQVKGQWKISALLDWEFSFSNTWLWDVSNMLRYAHQIDPRFKTLFLKGLTSEGLKLPPYWEEAINTLNIFSLLDILRRSSPEKEPVKCKDIHLLILHFLEQNIKKLNLT